MATRIATNTKEQMTVPPPAIRGRMWPRSSQVPGQKRAPGRPPRKPGQLPKLLLSKLWGSWLKAQDRLQASQNWSQTKLVMLSRGGSSQFRAKGLSFGSTDSSISRIRLVRSSRLFRKRCSMCRYIHLCRQSQPTPVLICTFVPNCALISTPFASHGLYLYHLLTPSHPSYLLKTLMSSARYLSRQAQRWQQCCNCDFAECWSTSQI